MKCKILIVDDKPQNLFALEKTLQKLAEVLGMEVCLQPKKKV